MSVVVFGSINMDLVARTPHLPARGETITGYEFFTAAGGKGANQAVAAARLHVSTTMVGRVGDDAFGQELRQHLAGAGVNTSAILTDTGVSSGVAVIAVDDEAQNNIIIIPGANGRVGQADVARLEDHLAGANVLLLQLEVPLEATLAAARVAHRQGVTVILDPAPALDLPAELYHSIDMITPNEVEAAQLTGLPVKTRQDAARAAEVLLSKGTPSVIIKMGAAGVFYVARSQDGSGVQDFIPAFQVKAIDTVAAGDAFNGGLATALVEGYDLATAVRWGAAAGALSTTKAGAQPSMPARPEFNAFLKARYTGGK
jgi:ribokinase